MKILGHIHCFNSENVIDRSLQAFLDQERKLDHIVLVDNGSTDTTLEREFPDCVTVLHNEINGGTSGGIITGMKYAIENDFDWIWVMDHDSAPEPDALKKLVELYERLDPEEQKKVWLVSSIPMEVPKEAVVTPFSVTLTSNAEKEGFKPRHAVYFHEKGYTRVEPDPDKTWYEFDSTIWSGSLYKVEAIKDVGLPEADYFLDWGEYVYGYLGKQKGYKAIMNLESRNNHNVGAGSSFSFTTYKWGPIKFKMIELPAIRCYYVVRNTLYFWWHVYPYKNIYTLAPRIYKIVMLTANFLLRPFTRFNELTACWRGIVHALENKMYKRHKSWYLEKIR